MVRKLCAAARVGARMTDALPAVGVEISRRKPLVHSIRIERNRTVGVRTVTLHLCEPSFRNRAASPHVAAH